ncbi:hypothetical protein ACHHYP_02553 [Achlya hypogyna]|uniref:Complex 1 LYR protein n=1 Tax=Achlya hypogyna TaxID=1202772 RepID=A0A1V9Z5Y7_ACHHY|nr:hypothetical protein ACHHYP_02553 [Achlya hypogyna]
MQSRVRDLYKRFLLVGKDYPLGLEYVRPKVKEAFFQQAQLQDDADIKVAVARGRWMVKEMIGVIQLKKYRAMNQRYTPAEMHMLLRTLHEEAQSDLAMTADDDDEEKR